MYDFEWISEFQLALRDLKKYLSSLPLISKDKEQKLILMYLAVSVVAINHLSLGRKMCIIFNLICKQNFSMCEDQILALRKVDFGIGNGH